MHSSANAVYSIAPASHIQDIGPRHTIRDALILIAVPLLSDVVESCRRQASASSFSMHTVVAWCIQLPKAPSASIAR